MEISYSTKYWEIPPKEVVEEVKRLQKISKGQIFSEEEEGLRKRIFNDSLDLRLKKESISAIARSQSGVSKHESLDQRTIEYLRKKSIQVDCLANLMSQDSKYWFSYPQTHNYTTRNQRLHRQLPYYGIKYVLARLFWKSISFELLYTPLIGEVPESVKERITSDIEWMISNQCTMGVSRDDLFHAHICFGLDENGHFKVPELQEANQKVRNMQNRFPVLLTTQSFTSSFFKRYKEKIQPLYDELFKNIDPMLLLYHSFEHGNANHPLFINRTVLTGNSNRFCVIPTLDNLGVATEEIEGISELAIRFYFRINPRKGKTDKDLKHLEVYATPSVFSG